MNMTYRPRSVTHKAMNTGNGPTITEEPMVLPLTAGTAGDDTQISRWHHMAMTHAELPSEHRVFSFFFYICFYVHTHVPLCKSCHLCSGALRSLKIVSDIREMERGSGNTNMGSENQLRASARAANILNPLQPLAQVLLYESGMWYFF